VNGVLSGKKIWRMPLGLVLAWLAHSLPGAAADFVVEVACPEWSAESRGQVEARIRVTVLAEGLDPRRVRIGCQDSTVGISVEASTGSVTRPVERSSAPIEDVVVTAVEAALRELASRARGEPTGLPAPPPEPVAVPAAPARTPYPASAPAATPVALAIAVPRTVSELYATPTVGLFKERWALGGTLGVGVGTEALQYGLGVGGRTIAGLPAAFDATEWGACARLAWTPARAAGFRGTLGLGVSALVTDPADDVVSRSSSTVLSVAYLELQLSRPFWLGRFAVAPGLGVRLFSDRRNVRVNEREQLALPQVAPEATLSFVYRR
jgi:hypothetical protein